MPTRTKTPSSRVGAQRQQPICLHRGKPQRKFPFDLPKRRHTSSWDGARSRQPARHDDCTSWSLLKKIELAAVINETIYDKPHRKNEGKEHEESALRSQQITLKWMQALHKPGLWIHRPKKRIRSKIANGVVSRGLSLLRLQMKPPQNKPRQMKKQDKSSIPFQVFASPTGSSSQEVDEEFGELRGWEELVGVVARVHRWNDTGAAVVGCRNHTTGWETAKVCRGGHGAAVW